MRHTTRFFVAIALVAATVAAAGAQPSMPPPDPSAAAGEKAIATSLAEDSVGDVQLGELGIRKAHGAAVRAFARAMVKDHTRTAQAGIAAAQRLGADNAKLEPDSSTQVALTRLARYSGAAFDREYLKTLIDAHKSDIMLIEEALVFTTDPGLRAALTDALAIDRKHLRMAIAART
ncbi:MAG: putative outer membrane protein [Candidatus Eremiobacteraeota bacterium]|nr:putative outer membrane protein [Candidatus Eremiobacteraeota bacterium]